MSRTIQHRRGTAAQWTAANPVLASGEPGYETDTGLQKIGDGATVWADLPSASGGASTIGGIPGLQTALDGKLPLPLTRSAAEGSPNEGGQNSLTVVINAGAGPFDADGIIFFGWDSLNASVNFNGVAADADATTAIIAAAFAADVDIAADWTVEYVDGNSFVLTSISGTNEVTSLYDVNGTTATTYTEFVDAAVTPSAVGQSLMVGGPLSTNRVPYIAISVDPPIWRIAGPFAENQDVPGTYKHLAYVGGTLDPQDYPLS